jgi:hypothetical protein
MQTRKPSDLDRIVAQIDEARQAEHWRNPDRPNGQFVKRRRRQDPKIRRAKGRVRTAVWRNGLDRLGRPEARDIGMAMVAALVTSENLLDMTQAELRFVTAALANLENRGFARDQILQVLRRLRTRLVDPEDREGESTGEPIGRSGMMF